MIKIGMINFKAREIVMAQILFFRPAGVYRQFSAVR